MTEYIHVTVCARSFGARLRARALLLVAFIALAQVKTQSAPARERPTVVQKKRKAENRKSSTTIVFVRWWWYIEFLRLKKDGHFSPLFKRPAAAREPSPSGRRAASRSARGALRRPRARVRARRTPLCLLPAAAGCYRRAPAMESRLRPHGVAAGRRSAQSSVPSSFAAAAKARMARSAAQSSATLTSRVRHQRLKGDGGSPHRGHDANSRVRKPGRSSRAQAGCSRAASAAAARGQRSGLCRPRASARSRPRMHRRGWPRSTAD